MTWLGEQPDTLFIGQAVGYAGTGMTGTLSGVPTQKKLELPVAEEMQMGMTIGLSLAGKVPVSIYTRWNFLLLATNQLVNHLDKMPELGYKPRVIIRTGVGSEKPLHPGPQHTGDFTDGFQRMCRNVEFIRLTNAKTILSAYQTAYARTDGRATVLVEISDMFNG